MKVLYIVSNPTLGLDANTGYGRHIRATISGFRASGHEVIVRTALNSKRKDGHSNSRPRHFQRSHLVKRVIPKLVWESVKDFVHILNHFVFRSEILSTINEYKPDIIYERVSYLTFTSKNAPFIPWYLEVNSPLTEERIALSGNSLFTGLAVAWERGSYRKAKYVFCVSNVLKKYLIERFHVNSNLVKVNPNGVDLEVFRRTELESHNANADFVIGFVGSILPYHGIPILIKVFANLISKEIQVRLLIVGDGQSLDEYKQQVVDLGLDTKVLFTGGVSRNEVPSYINAMDVCVVPSSNWYGSPVKLFEYGAMKKAVVAIRVAPISELFEDGQDVLLFDEEHELEIALKELYYSEDKRKELADRIYRKVANSYTWKQNTERILKTIE